MAAQEETVNDRPPSVRSSSTAQRSNRSSSQDHDDPMSPSTVHGSTPLSQIGAHSGAPVNEMYLGQGAIINFWYYTTLILWLTAINVSPSCLFIYFLFSEFPICLKHWSIRWNSKVSFCLLERLFTEPHLQEKSIFISDTNYYTDWSYLLLTVCLSRVLSYWSSVIYGTRGNYGLHYFFKYFFLALKYRYNSEF